MISFRHDTPILIAGPTQTGKTFFFNKILEHQLIQPAPSRISYVFLERAPDVHHLKTLYPSIEYVQQVKDFLDILLTILN